MPYEKIIQNLPQSYGNPTCSAVEPSWANVFKKGIVTPSMVVMGDSVLAELESGIIFGDIHLPVLVKNPYENVPKKEFGVRNCILNLAGQLIVCSPGLNKQEWEPKRNIDWDNLLKPTDVFLVKNYFKYYLEGGEYPRQAF